MARMGPISGEINIEATRETVEFSTSPELFSEWLYHSTLSILVFSIYVPMKAIAAAATRYVTKSNENSAPDSIL